jgi:hypothetical protein
MFIPYPASAAASHNGCHEACDMLVGPCACGATHALTDWNPGVIAAYEMEHAHVGLHGYIAYYERKTIVVWGKSVLAARSDAARQLGVKTKNEYKITLYLSLKWNEETSSHQQVSHSTTSF